MTRMDWTQTSMVSAASRHSAVTALVLARRALLIATLVLSVLAGTGNPGAAQSGCDPSYPTYCVPPGADPECNLYVAEFPDCCAMPGSGDPGFSEQDPTISLPCESWYPCDGWCD